MEIAFSSKSLRDLCAEENIATEQLGKKSANMLQHRLNDIRAASCVNELPTGNPRVINNRKQDTYLIDLHDDICILICANHNKNPVTESNTIDWKKVSRVKVIKVGVYHD